MSSGFRVIRAGLGYSMVLVMSPPDAMIGDAYAAYYEYNPGRSTPGWNHEGFNKISWADDARYLFSGQADWLGFAELPTEPFPSLDAVLAYIRKERESLRRDLEEWRADG